MPTFDTPGVYILEETGPGVIAGVGTSTAGFIGPARRGPFGVARRVSSYDAFLSIYGVLQKDGSFDPFLKDPQIFLPHAVRGFFENGGTQAFIIRIGTALTALWSVKNNAGEEAFQVEALDAGTAGNEILITIQNSIPLTGATGVKAVTAAARVKSFDAAAKTIELSDTPPFVVDDTVMQAGGPSFTIREIQGKVLKVNTLPTTFDPTKPLRIADLDKKQPTLRMASAKGLHEGSLVKIKGKDTNGNDAEDYGLIQAVNPDGIVTFVIDVNKIPERGNIFKVDGADAPTLTSLEFDIKVTPRLGEEETFKNLSLQIAHPRFFHRKVSSKLVELLPSAPRAIKVPDRLVSTNPVGQPVRAGTDDDPEKLRFDDYNKGLNVLKKIDDVNLVCIPDAATNPDADSIQRQMIVHCEQLQDRFAILDSKLGLTPDDVEVQRQGLESERGFGALYYPWLEVLEPGSTEVPPKTMLIPPSGHIAGVFARTDQERGVHKAPANTDVRAILGLERVLSDREQGPLNLEGINVLRIFPGSRIVVVWGARTIVNPIISDWLYVNVRRLLLFIEESIQEGIRFAVFEPNAPPLWKALKRTISQFLTQVWRDGALFGDTPDQAFRVRIDEGLNPPSERARGKLFIEIRVAPVRPAEFIIVKIGLFDGGAEVEET